MTALKILTDLALVWFVASVNPDVNLQFVLSIEHVTTVLTRKRLFSCKVQRSLWVQPERLCSKKKKKKGFYSSSEGHPSMSIHTCVDSLVPLQVFQICADKIAPRLLTGELLYGRLRGNFLFYWCH